MHKIEKIISSIRNSHPDIYNLYMYGQCYNFFLILRSIFGQRVHAWYDHIEGHIYSKIDDKWYDIRGVHYKVSKYCLPLNHNRKDKPHRWGKRDKRRLK